jgi:hypothetical protein
VYACTRESHVRFSPQVTRFPWLLSAPAARWARRCSRRTSSWVGDKLDPWTCNAVLLFSYRVHMWFWMNLFLPYMCFFFLISSESSSPNFINPGFQKYTFL